QCPMGVAQAVVGEGIIFFQADRFLEGWNRLIRQALFQQSKAEVGIGLSVLLEVKGTSVFNNGLAQEPLPKKCSAKAGIGLEIALVEAKGFVVAGDGLV